MPSRGVQLDAEKTRYLYRAKGWSQHATYPSDIVHLQVLFPPPQTAWHVDGFTGEFESREMRSVPRGPVLSPTGDSASWVIRNPDVGTYFKTAWASPESNCRDL